MKYVCELCGMVYDETIGDPIRGIPAVTAFADLPAEFSCSGCGSQKEAFDPVSDSPKVNENGKEDRAFWVDAKYSDDKLESER